MEQELHKEINIPKKFNRKQFILIGVSSLLIVGVIVALVLNNRSMDIPNSASTTSENEPSNSQKVISTQEPTITNTSTPTPSSELSRLIWQQGQSGWMSMETPPVCESTSMVTSPIDLSKVTSILYPGQTRGGNYKPHGGFRLDKNPDNNVQITAPFDGYAVRGGSYLAEGEVQYTFDVMNNCGVMYRVGHFRELPSDMFDLTKTWPKPVEGDSRTHQINPPVFIKKGHVLATTVGIKKDKNVFFDFGVYDYRNENEASKNSNFQQKHAQDKELSWHAVCWFDWMSSSDEAKVRSLPPGDPQSGKISDYCK